jgi:hypothetical protein
VKINILGRKNTVEFSDRAPGDTALGRANSGEDRIWIWSGLTPEAKEETLIHEWLHQVSEYTGIGLTEQQVSVLGIALHLADLRIQYL